MSLSRRAVLAAGSALGVALVTRAESAGAQGRPSLDVAYAGSMSSLMEGPVKALAAQRLDVEFQGRAAGSSGLAQQIVAKTLVPDVFVSVTPSPMQAVLAAGLADTAVAVARTAMVIAYSPKSTFAAKLADTRAGAEPWWRVLQEPGFRFGRTDPVVDPSGRNTIFVLQLAAKKFGQADLVEKALGDVQNPTQIFLEPTIEARLQSGELDAAGTYRIQPAAFKLPYVSLGADLDLSDARQARAYAAAGVTVGGKAFKPEPLVYYAAALKSAAHPEKAAAFVKLLAAREGQDVFRRSFYDPAGDAAPLRA